MHFKLRLAAHQCRLRPLTVKVNSSQKTRDGNETDKFKQANSCSVRSKKILPVVFYTGPLIFKGYKTFVRYLYDLFRGRKKGLFTSRAYEPSKYGLSTFTNLWRAAAARAASNLCKHGGKITGYQRDNFDRSKFSPFTVELSDGMKILISRGQADDGSDKSISLTSTDRTCSSQ